MAKCAKSSYNFLFSSVNGSSKPIPIFAKPSVHNITVEPGLPFDAISIADTKAGPNAVCPLAYCFVNCFINVS